MKKLLILLVFMPAVLYSTERADSIKSWNFGGLAGFNFSQVSLTNWAAGGKSSTSGVALFNVFANYKREKISWENSLDMGYGLLKEADNNAVKSNDKFDFNSKFGVKKTDKLYYSVLYNLKTQFAPGYNYPNDSVAISRFLAPAYMTLSLGIDYKPTKVVSIFVSPLTGKMTIVSDHELSALGAFGVDPGKTVRTEVGSFVKLEVKTDIMKNVSLNSKLDLFSNYVHNPENIDVNWYMMVNMKINDYLSANLITNLVYDDDIKIAIDKNSDGILESNGPRVQFKEMFGLGINLKF